MVAPLDPAWNPRTPREPVQISRLAFLSHIFKRRIIWRSACTIISGVLLLLVIYIFQTLGSLSRWEKRAFNTLAILFSSLVSLSLGSLMEVCGNMARWPLLAMKDQKHGPADVSPSHPLLS
jgi:hypothetical protein